MLKARLQPWIEEAHQISQNIQEKLKSLQQTHRTMKLVIKGPTIEELVEDVKKVVVQSTTEINALKQ